MPINMFCNKSPEKGCFAPWLLNLVNKLRSLTHSSASKNSKKTFFENIVRERSTWGSDFDTFYEVDKLIGEGSIGTVFIVNRKPETIGGSARLSGRSSLDSSRHTKSTAFSAGLISNNTPRSQSQETYRYALKTIQLNRISETFIKELRNEVEILKSLDHPNIVRPVEIFESTQNRRLFVVMELCSGGDLFSRDPYTERDAVTIVGKLLSALSYMHAKNVMHRDIKYENIMFEHAGPDAEVKLIDFGLSAKYMPEDPKASGTIGTIYTMSPEVLRKAYYTNKTDLWSLGVVTHMLLSGHLPFYGSNKNKVISRILKCKVSLNSSPWLKITEDAKNFVKTLLQFDPFLRPTADKALKHPWLMKQFRLSQRYPGDAIMKQVPKAMQRYSTYSNFKKMSLMLIAHSSTTSEICELRKVFDQYDTANNGFISHAEFKHALSRFDNKYSEEEIDKLFNAVNFDEGGLINYTEFLAATLETVGHIEEERLAGAFDRFDDDDSGFISKKNLRRILGKTYTEAKVEQLIAEGDYENDGKISYEEFLMLFRDDCEKEKMVFRKSIRETHPEVFINFNSEETQVTQTSEYSDTSSNVSARKNSILLS